MLGKIFKYEIKETSRLFLPLMMGFILITALCKFSFEGSISLFSDRSNILNAITGVFFVLYFIYIIALFVMTSVFIVTNFYKTMVSSQGYLTHTLPVKTSTLINAKLLAAIFWEVMAGLLFILSIILFLLGHVKISDINDLLMDFQYFMDYMAVYINVQSFFIKIFISTILTLISGPVTLYASIAIGHLFNKHRVLWAIISFFCIYMANQLLGSIVTGFIASRYNFYNFDHTGAALADGYMLYAIFYTIVTTSILYFLTNYIFSRKLNLE